jgi:hypothetical protein
VEAAANGTKAAGKAVSTAVGKLKTPLLVGGAAVAGVVGGVAVRSKTKSKRGPLSGLHMPGNGKGIDLDRMRKSIDFDKVASTARRVGSYGRQVGEVATAVERASTAAKKEK